MKMAMFIYERSVLLLRLWTSEDMGEEVAEAAAPGEPFVVGAGRDVEVCLDAGVAQVANQSFCAEVLLAAGAEIEVVDFLVEFIGACEDAIVGRSDIEVEDCSAESSHPCELIHIVQHDVEGLVTTP